MAVIRENKGSTLPGGTIATGAPSRKCELIAIFKTDYMCAGLAPYNDNLVSDVIVARVVTS